METETKKDNKLLKVLRMIVGLPFFFLFIMAWRIASVEFLQILYAFAREGVFPFVYILEKICFITMFLIPAAGFLSLAFPKILPGLTFGKTVALTFAFIFGAAAFSVTNQMEKDSWPWHYYPPYIEQYETKVLYETVECDYGSDVKFSGYMKFTTKGFKEKQTVQVIQDASLTDRYRIEVHYKGNEAELDIYNYNGEENINIYLKNYDYKLSPKDTAYMYKHKINLEYSDPLAVEKVIIRTAYPEKIDIQDIITD